MTGPDTLTEIAAAFQARQVRWLVVGGYAVIAHGHLRMTHDLDLILDPEPGNCRAAIEAFAEMGFRPRLPVPMLDFADPAKRQEWHDHRDMVVFTIWRQPPGRFEQVDLFLREPFPFPAAWADRHRQALTNGLEIPCIDLRRLITMKQEAGRPKDLDDIAELRRHGAEA